MKWKTAFSLFSSKNWLFIFKTAHLQRNVIRKIQRSYFISVKILEFQLGATRGSHWILRRRVRIRPEYEFVLLFIILWFWWTSLLSSYFIILMLNGLAWPCRFNKNNTNIKNLLKVHYFLQKDKQKQWYFLYVLHFYCVSNLNVLLFGVSQNIRKNKLCVLQKMWPPNNFCSLAINYEVAALLRLCKFYEC